jgi:hypothetical protein
MVRRSQVSARPAFLDCAHVERSVVPSYFSDPFSNEGNGNHSNELSFSTGSNTFLCRPRGSNADGSPAQGPSEGLPLLPPGTKTDVLTLHEYDQWLKTHGLQSVYDDGRDGSRQAAQSFDSGTPAVPARSGGAPMALETGLRSQ